MIKKKNMDCQERNEEIEPAKSTYGRATLTIKTKMEFPASSMGNRNMECLPMQGISIEKYAISSSIGKTKYRGGATTTTRRNEL